MDTDQRSITERLLCRPEVEAMTGMSCSGIYRSMELGQFPRPRRIGTGPNGAVRWLQSDIQEWMSQLPIADPKKALRGVLSKLRPSSKDSKPSCGHTEAEARYEE